MRLWPWKYKADRSSLIRIISNLILWRRDNPTLPDLHSLFFSSSTTPTTLPRPFTLSIYFCPKYDTGKRQSNTRCFHLDFIPETSLSLFFEGVMRSFVIFITKTPNTWQGNIKCILRFYRDNRGGYREKWDNFTTPSLVCVNTLILTTVKGSNSQYVLNT